MRFRFVLWSFLVFLLAKQRVECRAKSGKILQLDGFYFIQHRTYTQVPRVLR